MVARNWELLWRFKYGWFSMDYEFNNLWWIISNCIKRRTIKTLGIIAWLLITIEQSGRV